MSKLLVKRGRWTFHPQIRIHRNSGYCCGPQWTSAMPAKGGGITYGGEG